MHLWTNLLGSLQRSPRLPNWFYGGKKTGGIGDKENVENIKGKSRNSRIRTGQKEKGMGGWKEREIAPRKSTLMAVSGITRVLRGRSSEVPPFLGVGEHLGSPGKMAIKCVCARVID